MQLSQESKKITAISQEIAPDFRLIQLVFETCNLEIFGLFLENVLGLDVIHPKEQEGLLIHMNGLDILFKEANKSLLNSNKEGPTFTISLKIPLVELKDRFSFFCYRHQSVQEISLFKIEVESPEKLVVKDLDNRLWSFQGQ